MPLPAFLAAFGLSGPALAGVAAATVVAVGAGVYGYSEYQKNQTEQQAVAPVEKPAEQPKAEAPETPSAKVEAAEPVKEAAPEPKVEAPKIEPAFDIFRVEQDGSFVAAGSAAPGATVEMLVNGNPFAQAKAGPGGDWAIVPAGPLPKGDHVISLRAQAADGEMVASASSLNVSVKGADTLVALAEPGKPSQVLQKPEPAPAPEKAEPAVAEPVKEEAAPIVKEEPVAEPAKEVVQDKPAEKPAPQVTIGSVDVEEGKALHVQGSAPKGQVVRLYLNDQPIGDRRAGIGDQFSLSIERAMEPGRYTVRADLLDGNNEVASRAEVKFDRVRLAEAKPEPAAQAEQPAEASPAEPAQTAPDIPDLEITRGDNLWRIARRIYGQGIRYTVIYEANKNQIRNPHRIYPGQVFTIPVVEGETEQQ